MKKLYHLSLSSSDEVLFRSHEDYRRAYNCYVQALLKSGSSSFGDAFMSNHIHTCLVSGNLKQFCYTFKIGYGLYLNKKYKRRGPLVDEDFFVLEVEGIHHILAALSYVMRNPLHHGVTSTPFEYPYSSANVIFRKELGKSTSSKVLDRDKMWKYLPKNTTMNIPYRMGPDGMFLREDVTEVKQVELLYGTPRNFMYYMNRLSDVKWETEQRKDDVKGHPVTIGTIENYKGKDISVLLKNEYGRVLNSKINDIDLCTIIDADILNSYGVHSVYELSASQKEKIGNLLYSKYKVNGVTVAQLKRCLVIR